MKRPSRVTIRVPATSANLGAGFDTLGLALGMYDSVVVRLADRGSDFVSITGEGAQTLPRDASHVIVSTVRSQLKAHGIDAHAVSVASTNRIPHARGLGSSAAAVVAGVVAAQLLAGARRLDRAEIVSAAAAIEGHADNVAACVYGSLTIAWHDTETGSARATSLKCAPGVSSVVLVPEQRSATARTRRLLPESVPHADAAFTAAHSALTVAALTRTPDLLPAALDDRIHEPYRSRSMRASSSLVKRLRAEGFAAAISGGGSSVVVLHGGGRDVALTRRVAAIAGEAFHALSLPIDTSGVVATVG
jgi:homoserine kinase